MTLSLQQPTKQYLVTRRRAIRQERLWEKLKIFWRYGLLIAFVSLGIWIAKGPLWEIQSLDQIEVRGNRVLSTSYIRNRVPLSLPRKVFEIEPSTLERVLRQEPLMYQVEVRRQIWPPQLEVYVQERIPVAMAPRNTELGVIDQEGVWLSLNRYPKLKPLPLNVTGYTDNQKKFWQGIYPLLVSSPQVIHRIDLSSAHNLVLYTELGKVHLGRPDPNVLQEQLHTLDRLRDIPRQVPKDHLDFIDLASPLAPQLRQRPPTLPPVVPTP